MEKVWIFLQHSNVDGEHHINVTPCADLETAKAEMQEEINTLLSEGKYEGLDLDEIESNCDDDDADCDFWLDRNETSFYLGCKYDDYYEHLDIMEKEIVSPNGKMVDRYGNDYIEDVSSPCGGGLDSRCSYNHECVEAFDLVDYENMKMYLKEHSFKMVSNNDSSESWEKGDTIAHYDGYANGSYGYMTTEYKEIVKKG